MNHMRISIYGHKHQNSSSFETVAHACYTLIISIAISTRLLPGRTSLQRFASICHAGSRSRASPTGFAIHRSPAVALIPLSVAQEGPANRTMLSCLYLTGASAPPTVGCHTISLSNSDPTPNAAETAGARAERYHGLQPGCSATSEKVCEGTSGWLEFGR